MRTLLFDIDGTLLTIAGGGQRAFARALHAEFGVQQPDADVIFSGRTDRSLLVELLQRNSLSPTPEACGRLRRRYLGFFQSELNTTGGTLMPGARQLLQQLQNHADVVVAVMTGNFPESATRKLEHFDLRGYVQWIVGGDLDVHRDDMARRASTMISSRYGEKAARDVIVIGDTPADVQCAHAIGARALAVATGGHSTEQLQQCDPWCVVEDFRQTDAIVQTLLGSPARRQKSPGTERRC